MGFANIAANNGWAMAFLGAGIVMTGLIILSLAISQIHKLVDLLERRQKKADQAPAPAVVMEAESPPPPLLTGQCPINLDELAALYQPLTEPLGAPFELKELYRVAGEADLPHPHITIRCFREAGFLTMEGEGLFSWKP